MRGVGNAPYRKFKGSAAPELAPRIKPIWESEDLACCAHPSKDEGSGRTEGIRDARTDGFFKECNEKR